MSTGARPAAKSTLREIRHLQAIPELADWDRRWEDESEKGERIAAAREARTRRAWDALRAATDPELQRYLFSRQHDAWIQSSRREGDRLTITVYDEDLEALAHRLYGTPWGEAKMPFDVVFEGVTYLGWRRVESDDRLLFASEPKGAVEWLADSFVDAHLPGVRWALQYYVSGTRRRDRNHVMFIEADRLRIVERQRAVWLARFGDAAMEIFDRYQAVRGEIALANDPGGLDRFLATAPS